MCCECSNIFKILTVALAIILVIILVFIVIYNENNEKNPNILVAIAKAGDNTTLGTTTIRFSQNNIVEGMAISHQVGSD